MFCWRPPGRRVDLWTCRWCISCTGFELASAVQVRPGSDHVQLPAELWQYLRAIYGGGPELPLVPASQQRQHDHPVSRAHSDGLY